MRNRKDGYIAVKDLVHHRVWEMPEVVASSAILVFGPIFCRVGQIIDSVEQLDRERIRSYRASLEIPEECFARLRLRLGQNFNMERTHRELRRCRTSVQAAACTRPARNSARRRFTSVRHNSETAASSAVSRLSSRATAKAERSSTGRPSTSSSRWSTRAFIGFSLAPRARCGKGSTDNISIDADTRLPRMRRAGKVAHRLSLRAGAGCSYSHHLGPQGNQA